MLKAVGFKPVKTLFAAPLKPPWCGLGFFLTLLCVFYLYVIAFPASGCNFITIPSALVRRRERWGLIFSLLLSCELRQGHSTLFLSLRLLITTNQDV